MEEQHIHHSACNKIHAVTIKIWN